MGIGGRAPAQNFRMLGDPGSTQATPRPVMVKAEPSYGSLDMEAEIRRRRAQQQAASGASMPGAQLGGWYTPKVAAGMDAQTSTSSVTVDMPNVDKPMPPTPSVRWAVGDIVADPRTPAARARSQTVSGCPWHRRPLDPRQSSTVRRLHPAWAMPQARQEARR